MPPETNAPTPAEVAARTAGNATPGDTANNDVQQAKPADQSPRLPQTQEELDHIIEKRLARERSKFSDYNDLKAKAGKFDEIEDAKKTQEERYLERIKSLEGELQASRLSATRSDLAAKHGISPELLRGSTPEELAEHAEALAAALEAAKPSYTPPAVPGEGAKAGAASSGGDWLRDAFLNS